MENKNTYLPQKIDDMSSYESHYNENRFWEKIQDIAKKAGSTILRPVLLLYYTLQDSNVPIKTKAYIIGALGYFILPVDIIPDFIAVLGYTDDFAVVTLLIKHLKDNITSQIEEKADLKIQELLNKKN